MYQLMQTLIGVVQQQATTGDRMMEQRQGGMIEFKRWAPLAFEMEKLEQGKRSQETEQCTWETFKAAFYEKYFPKSVRFQKENEFIKLQQGSMTVSQYEAEFAKLAKFAPALVADKENKVLSFHDGLRPQIKPRSAII
uniref:Retrotransposon gag domain-containing protein n=1 Tax=Fagus sylvatica TaxID=28930 RepID=A0A2N9F3X1_FAGSY